MDISSTGSGLFNTAVDMAQEALRYIPTPGARAAESVLGSNNTTTVDIAPEYRELIDRQIETQLLVQEVTMTSNIERSNHEARMASVRNIRVS